MRARTVSILVSLPLLVALGACGDDSSSEDPVDIESVEWRLTDLVGADIADTASPTLLLADRMASGSGGCNQFNGAYTLDGVALAFGALATTRMACVPDVSATETAYLTALESVASFESDGDELRLLADSGDVVLVYTS
jgi:heat shock protein HslJ